MIRQGDSIQGPASDPSDPMAVAGDYVTETLTSKEAA